MKKAPTPTKMKRAFRQLVLPHFSGPDDNAPRFIGTTNPRHLRAIDALEYGPLGRESLDRIAGCSNGPELVAELRRLGLELPCHRRHCIDRDGRAVRPGTYELTVLDRKALAHWRNRYGKG